MEMIDRHLSAQLIALIYALRSLVRFMLASALSQELILWHFGWAGWNRLNIGRVFKLGLNNN